MLALFDIALYLLFPATSLWLARTYRWARAIGPVSLCYLVGMAYANQPLLAVHRGLAESASVVSVGLAIPLLLFSMDVVRWVRLARDTLVSFSLAVLAVFVVTVAAGWAGRQLLPDSPAVAGMLAGVYTGGTPNLGAVGIALGSSFELISNTNAADLFLSAIYAFFLFTAAQRVFGRVLRPYRRFVAGGEAGDTTPPAAAPDRPAPWRHGVGLLLALAILAVGGAIHRTVPAAYNNLAAAILAITSFAVLASLSPKVRALPGTTALGQYALLSFCLSTGALADFRTLLTTNLPIFFFVVVVIHGCIALHLALAALCRIDVDTMIITSTAAIFSPAFVPPVADALKNRDVVIG
ncbi:MAG: DUF819 family protein, partial [Deltaproteobacteria bacterium]|nr:DUF819 family protein [Deltaproteobacteria bacterium]